MEGLPFKEAARGLASEIKHLASQKHTLEEELLQCKADKDFVWNLWKRLQTEKPDMASVISMVVSREKEKAERKDLKILEILRLKDEKIVEMREALNADKEEMKMNKERLHDLLIENDELKQKLDEHENELSSKMKEMEERTREIEEKNQYLSQLVKAYQEEKEAKDKELKDNLEQIDSEKNGLKSKIKYLEDEVEKLNEDRTSLGEAMKTNANLKEQIQEMEKTLQNLKSNSESCEKQYDEAVTTLRIRENHLQDKDKEVIALRERMIDFRNSHDQALVKIREQTEMIEHLQGMQDQVYRVMEDHKQSYEREITSLHKEVEDLQHQCTEYHRNEDHFQNEIGALKQSKASDFEDIMAKDQQIEELQQKIIEIGRTHSSPQKRARFEEPCKRCKELEEKLENLSAEREDLSDVLQEKSRRISSLEKTIKSSLTSKVSAKKDLLVETYHDKLHPGSPVNQKINRLEKRIQDLKSLIGLKDSELTEVRQAHNQRQQRYQLLKENYGLVQNQLKTFENEPVERTPPRRPSERALRHENSDGVWNELTYYRGEYEKLNKERHDVLEELDILRVEHANDLTTIQELRLCLEEEKEGLLNQLEEDKKKTIDYARESKKSELLKDEISLLRKTEQESKSRMQELEEEIIHCKQELKLLAEDNANLKRNAVHLEKQLNSASCEIEDRIVECKRLKETLGENEMNISPIKFAEVKTKDNELIKQQAKDIDMYDLQLKKIAERILSPSKQHKKDLSPTRKESQGTQTIEMSRTADFSSFVDFNQSDLEVGVVEVDARAKNVQLDEKVDNLKKISNAQTPRGKKIATTTKKTPVKGEWSGMRQRILSLTQQVAAIRSAKDKAVKALNEEKTTNENLQSELNNVLQRFQVSKNTVQTLTDDLKKCLKEKEEILAYKENADQNDAEIIKRKYEEKLRITSSELSRLNALVKTHRNEKNDLKEKLSDSQERLTRVEKDLAQKKTFVEEMKNKLRQAKDAEERSDDTVKDLEERIKRLTERDTQKKLQLDSLKRQLENEAKEKAKLSQQYLLSVEEVKKKSHLLADSRSLHAQADKAVSEMEAAATEQLQSLASKSETALKALRGKLSKAEARIEEFQALIKTLTDELIADNERTCFEIAQFEEQLKKDELDKPSSKHARHLACSILNMTSDDLDEFMKENEKQSEEQTARKGREREWKEAVDMLLKKEVPFAVPLIEVLLDIIEGSKSLGGRLLQLTNKNT